MTPEPFTVEYYVDSHGHDCYRICLVGGPCSTVSSAHLVDERKAQMLRFHTTPTPS